jgi:hypothetical protein
MRFRIRCRDNKRHEVKLDSKIPQQYRELREYISDDEESPCCATTGWRSRYQKQPNNQEDKKMASDPPYIDLRDAPFSVVANDSSPAAVAQNTAGINSAITTYSGIGKGANLVLPNGEIFVEEQAGGAEISSLARAYRS